MDKRLLKLTSREVERILKQLGFQISRQKGSHVQYVGIIAGRKRRVTVIAGQSRLSPKTIKSMIEQSGLREQAWLYHIK